MIKKLLPIMLAIPLQAGAWTIGGHLATIHIPQGDFCSINPGVYARADNGFTIGMYKNSDCRTSFYAGETWEPATGGRWGFALTLGIVTGYKAHPVMPMLVPSVSYSLGEGWAARVAFVPKVEKHSANAIHFMIERKF